MDVVPSGAVSSSEAGDKTGLHFLTIAVLQTEGISTPLPIQPGPAFPTVPTTTTTQLPRDTENLGTVPLSAPQFSELRFLSPHNINSWLLSEVQGQAQFSSQQPRGGSKPAGPRGSLETCFLHSLVRALGGGDVSNL